MIYIGGFHEKSFIEVHDIRFIVANAIEETYEDLRRTWWGGTPESLHIDAWACLKEIEGYGISLKDIPPF